MHTQQKSKIENFAFDYLRHFYIQRHAAKDVFIHMGVASKSGAMADGLFTYQKNNEEPAFVAALVTEHSAKLEKILTAYKHKAFKKTSIALALLLTIATTFLVFTITDHILLSSTPVITVGPLTYIVSRLLYRLFRERQIANLLHIFKKLPANEKWLGISVSSRTLRKNVLAQRLQKMCRERGIGILTVGKRAKVVLVQEPEKFNRRQGDFLTFYKPELEIRKEMLGDNIMRVA